MSDQGTAPLTLLGSNISYFTGKMENYLRLKQIPYQLESMQFPVVRKVLERELGVMQMPAIILPDGRYMTDSTKMIEWFEARHPSTRFCRRILCSVLSATCWRIGLMSGGGDPLCITAGTMPRVRALRLNT